MGLQCWGLTGQELTARFSRFRPQRAASAYAGTASYVAPCRLPFLACEPAVLTPALALIARTFPQCPVVGVLPSVQILDSYERTLDEVPASETYEHSEMLMYKAQVRGGQDRKGRVGCVGMQIVSTGHIPVLLVLQDAHVRGTDNKGDRAGGACRLTRGVCASRDFPALDGQVCGASCTCVSTAGGTATEGRTHHHVHRCGTKALNQHSCLLIVLCSSAPTRKVWGDTHAFQPVALPRGGLIV